MAVALPNPAPDLSSFPSVLIVDGDADTRMLYRTLFQGVAKAIVEADDGAEAFGKALCGRPDIILTETVLPRVDGFALCSMLRKEAVTRRAAIIVVTSAALPEDTARAMDAGADAVLLKPCCPEEVVDAAARAWQRHVNASAEYVSRRAAAVARSPGFGDRRKASEVTLLRAAVHQDATRRAPCLGLPDVRRESGV